MMSCQDNGVPYIYSLKNDTGIDFNNELIYTQELNPYTYRNYYNGAGVGVGDLNNDGLEDIYFSGNQVDNRLYRNLGNLRFEEVQNDLISCADSWSTGVSIVDINADGLKDIYVCKAGPPEGPNRSNQLFINMGDFIFEDQSKAYGLDIKGFSIHASFFDFDRDGDLDCYLLNNSIRPVGGYDLRPGLRDISTTDGNKLLVNIDGKFVDQSKELGIYTSEIGFGLGVVTSDLNNDGWPDIYVSNDFFERDYYYLNRDGIYFEEVGEEYFSSFSLGSMGVDAADIDNDGDQDILVAEMAPKSIERKKTKATYDGWDKYTRSVKNGYYHQYPRNMLHLNQGDYYYDVSRMKGIEATEWSWAPLMFDMNNDGLKDIFISNGVGKDLLDRDYLTYMADDQEIAQVLKADNADGLKKLIDIMPSQKIANQYHLQNDQFEFVEQTKLMRTLPPSFGNASAFSDLDNDGDFDLIISNINGRANILENTTERESSIRVDLNGSKSNPDAIGAKVTVHTSEVAYTEVNNPYRGFQSTVSQQLLFSVGSDELIEAITVQWPTGVIEQYELSTYSGLIELVEGTGKSLTVNRKREDPGLSIELMDTIRYVYPVRQFNEFNKEKLLVQMTPQIDPVIHIEPYDNLQLVFVGGSQNNPLTIYNVRTESFIDTDGDFEASYRAHVSDIVNFDYDNDGDQDLYVAHGSRVFSQYSTELNDIIYENIGDNKYRANKDIILFDKPIVTASVAHGDLNNDGYSDLIIAEKVKDDVYGIASRLFIYMNKAGVKFEHIGSSSLAEFGMINTVDILDIDHDGVNEVVVSGDWMGIKVLQLVDDEITDQSDKYGLSTMNGLWRDQLVVDVDGDGDMDIIGANQGLNSLYRDDIKMYVADFDGNGRKEQILTKRINGKDYPLLDYDEMVAQIASIRKKFGFYKDYSKASMDEIFGADILKDCLTYGLDELRSGIFINDGGTFEFTPFDERIQYSSMHAVEVADLNADGILDILIGGNHYLYKPQFGRDDASRGYALIADINNGEYRINKVEDLRIKGEIRNITKVDDNQFLVGVAGEKIRKYQISYEK